MPANPVLDLEDLRPATFNDPGVLGKLDYLESLIGSGGFSTLSAIPKGNGTGLTASSLSDDGTSVWTTGNEIHLNGGTAGSAAGWINYYSVGSAVTQFRDLNIGDGKGSPIATFFGSSKLTHMYGYEYIAGGGAGRFLYLGNTGSNYGCITDTSGAISIGGTNAIGGAMTTEALRVDPNTQAVQVFGTLTVSGATASIAASGTTTVGNLTAGGNFTVNSGSTVTIGSSTTFSNGNTTTFSGPLAIGTGSAPSLRSGTGTPEGTVTAPPGSLYLNTAGGAGTSLYVKQSGTGNTGWIGK